MKNSGEVVSPFSFAHKFAHFHYIYRGGGLFVDLACLRALAHYAGGRYAGIAGVNMGGAGYLRKLYTAVYIAIRRAGRGAVLYGGGVLQG